MTDDRIEHSTALIPTSKVTQPDYQKITNDNGKRNHNSLIKSSELISSLVATNETQPDYDEPLPPLNSNYIKASTADKLTSNPSIQQWCKGKLTTSQLEAFATTHIPTSVQVQLNQIFGKDTLFQSFYAENVFVMSCI